METLNRSAAFTPLQHPTSQGFRTEKRRKRRAPDVRIASDALRELKRFVPRKTKG
jgi:hypothetical protein